MRQRVLIAMVSFALGAGSVRGFCQVLLTDAQVATCKNDGAGLAKTDCTDLVQEFYVQKTAATLLKISLQDPIAHLVPFIVSQRQDAFMAVATMNLKTAAENDLEQAFQKTGASLNNTAQVLSTKSAVNQTGASPGSSGSTSLVTKPTTTDLISLAAESGAFTDSINGNTLTAQANVDGLRRYLSGMAFADLKPTAMDALNHIGLTATFTVAQSGSSGLSTTGSANSNTPSVANVVLPSNNVSFDSLSVNYSLLRKYNPHSSQFLNAWQKALGAHASDLAQAIKSSEVAVLTLSPARNAAEIDPTLAAARNKWLQDAKVDEANNDFDQFVKDYATFCKAFLAALRAADPKSYDANILSINTALGTLSEVNKTVLDEARGKPLLTLAYTYSTPQNKPATHQATFAGAYVWKSAGTQLTGNASGTWFASVPAGAKYGQIQSYQLSGELDQPIGQPTAPRATFSLAGYGQYQYSPTVLNITSGNLAPGTNITLPGNAQVLLGTAGWLGVAQTKLVFNIGKGMSIPVAVKWSNKTDLLNGSDWKGQFGFSYDLSALQSMLLPKK